VDGDTALAASHHPGEKIKRWLQTHPGRNDLYPDGQQTSQNTLLLKDRFSEVLSDSHQDSTSPAAITDTQPALDLGKGFCGLKFVQRRDGIHIQQAGIVDDLSEFITADFLFGGLYELLNQGRGIGSKVFGHDDLVRAENIKVSPGDEFYNSRTCTGYSSLTGLNPRLLYNASDA
jgi:hypothetical protein